MEEKQTLFEFLDDQLPTYYNPLGVQIYLNTDSTLIVCSDFPGVGESDTISVEIFQLVKSFQRLKSLLKISKPEQLEKLSPIDLLALYEQGRMKVICMLDGFREMHFLKDNGTIYAKNHLQDIHKVEVPLNTADDFIKYTTEYYDSNKSFAYH